MWIDTEYWFSKGVLYYKDDPLERDIHENVYSVIDDWIGHNQWRATLIDKGVGIQVHILNDSSTY